MALGSRELILDEIITYLKDDNINMIGICGMSGVGKTTMKDEVFKRVKQENMFDKYTTTVASQKLDTQKIQSNIAECLSLLLHENNPDLRASRLNERLEGKKLLIIMDDVWQEFDFQALGITLQGGQRRCKILYTSRTQGLWLEFQSRRREVLLHALPNDEAWNLFKEKVGGILDEKPELVPIGKQIVRECAGLPLALIILGRALLGKGEHTWNDALFKLRTVSGVEQKIYESLRLSYDYLNDGEAKALFLLCSLFEEDSRIYVESLVIMGLGLRLFKEINSVEATRNRVLALLEHLQASCLVSSFGKEERYGMYFPQGSKFVTVHDVVRDVSKSIAFTEKGALILEHGDTLAKSQAQILPEQVIWISVIAENVRELPSRLQQFPNLELLRCNNGLGEIPDSCFEETVKLRVVEINQLQKVPSSFQSLTNLHTLCLLDCSLMDFSAIE